MNKDFGLVLKTNLVIILIAAAIAALVMAFANSNCPACGKRLLIRKHYCYHCGKKLDD